MMNRTKLSETIRLIMQAAAATVQQASMQPDPESVIAAFYDLPPEVRAYLTSTASVAMTERQAKVIEQGERNKKEFATAMDELADFSTQGHIIQQPPMPAPALVGSEDQARS